MKTLSLTLLFLFLIACSPTKEKTIEDYGAHYQLHQDHASLARVVELLAPNADTAYLKKILGEPIDMGFDYRYLIDSTGPQGCSVGAVFHIDAKGRIDQKWLDEICE